MKFFYGVVLVIKNKNKNIFLVLKIEVQEKFQGKEIKKGKIEVNL